MGKKINFGQRAGVQKSEVPEFSKALCEAHPTQQS